MMQCGRTEWVQWEGAPMTPATVMYTVQEVQPQVMQANHLRWEQSSCRTAVSGYSWNDEEDAVTCTSYTSPHSTPSSQPRSPPRDMPAFVQQQDVDPSTMAEAAAIAASLVWLASFAADGEVLADRRRVRENQRRKKLQCRRARAERRAAAREAQQTTDSAQEKQSTPVAARAGFTRRSHSMPPATCTKDLTDFSTVKDDDWTSMTVSDVQSECSSASSVGPSPLQSPTSRASRRGGSDMASEDSRSDAPSLLTASVRCRGAAATGVQFSPITMHLEGVDFATEEGKACQPFLGRRLLRVNGVQVFKLEQVQRHWTGGEVDLQFEQVANWYC